MNKLGITLKKLRESRNLTVKELAHKIGAGNGTIGNIERGANKTRTTTLEKISKALELNKNERDELFAALLPDDVGNKIKYSELKTAKIIKTEVVELPVYGKASAGNGYLNMSNILRTEYITTLPGEELPKGSFIVEVNGESMYPTLLDGDLAIVDPNCGENINNSICVLTNDGETFIKRVSIQNDYIILISDNPDRSKYKDIIISKNNCSLYCHGVVIERRTKFKKMFR